MSSYSRYEESTEFTTSLTALRAPTSTVDSLRGNVDDADNDADIRYAGNDDSTSSNYKVRSITIEFSINKF